MTEIEPTDSSTGRPKLFVRAIAARQAMIGAAVSSRVTCHDGSSQVVYRTIVYQGRVRERCGPSLSDCVVARQHIRIPARIGLPFLAAWKDAGSMRKDQCVAFRLHLSL
jgi:hypothetical protein